MSWILITAATIAGLYALHRLCLHLEDRGYLYYKRKRPRSGGSMSMFLPLAEFCQPQMQHVFHVEEQNEKLTEAKRGDGDGQDATAPHTAGQQWGLEARRESDPLVGDG